MKTITKIFSTIFKAAILTVIAVTLIPIAYFGYRMTQPMDLPQFKGLSYVQFVQWRTTTFRNSEVEYQQAHPHTDNTPQNGSIVRHGLCEGASLSRDVVEVPFSGLNALVTDYSRGWTNLAHFSQDWWKTYEEWIWSGAVADQVNLPNVSYCNLRLDIPTPAQLQTMQDLQQIANTPSTNASASRP